MESSSLKRDRRGFEAAGESALVQIGNTENSKAVVLSEKALQKGDYPLYFLLLGCSSAAILYFMWYWFSSGGGPASPLFFSLATLVLALKSAEHYARMLML